MDLSRGQVGVGTSRTANLHLYSNGLQVELETLYMRTLQPETVLEGRSVPSLGMHLYNILVWWSLKQEFGIAGCTASSGESLN